MSDEKNSFKTVKSENSSYSVPKGKIGFIRGFLVPFTAGVLGAFIIGGACISIPPVRAAIANNFFSAKIAEEKSDNKITKLEDFTTSSNTAVSLSKYSDTSIAVANKVLPSVVGIKVTYAVSSPYYSYYGMNSQTATATGSGVIITDDGYILTNNHVVSSTGSTSYYQVSKATNISVTLYNDETEYEAKIIGTDEQTDLAVLKIEKNGLTPAEIGNSSEIKVGEFAMAIGNPLNMPSTVTTGIISATSRTITSENVTYKVIQTDAAINSGNSGGALINAEGKVIGINTLKLAGSGIEGIGFAIPINDTINVYQDLITNGKVTRPLIGLTGRDINEATAKANKLPEGIYVVSVEDFSPAEKAGLKSGDVITEFDGKKVKTMNELNSIKNEHKPGDEVSMKITRDNNEQELKITLAESK